MTSAPTTPARGTGGRRAEGYGLIVFASVLLLVVGCFNLLDGIAAVANSHVFIANAHHVVGDLRAWGWGAMRLRQPREPGGLAWRCVTGRDWPGSSRPQPSRR